MPRIPTLTYEELVYCRGVIDKNERCQASVNGFLLNVSKSFSDGLLTRKEVHDLIHGL